DNTTVTGQVSDRGTGLATLRGQVDAGPLFKVAVDASGQFHFRTTLPLDGTADGQHRLRLRATDGAGNVSIRAIPFTLHTSLVNRAVTTDKGVQQMPSVAVDPADSRHVVIAYLDYSLVKTGYAGIGVAMSHDAGTSWQHTSVPLPANFDQGAAAP